MKLTAFVFVHFILLTAATSVWATEPIVAVKLENSVAVRGGTAMIASEATGSGFTVQQPEAMMLNYGIKIKNKPAESWVSILLDYNVTSGDQDVASGLTPTKISVERREYSFELLSEAFFTNDWGNFRAGVGYKMVDYSADETTPNAAVTSLNIRGPTASLKIKKEFANQTDALDSDLRLFFPHHIRESGVVTGSNPSAWGAELQIKFAHRILPQWQISLGLNYQYESISFEGTGTRGTVDATDIRTQFTLPIELEYLF